MSDVQTNVILSLRNFEKSIPYKPKTRPEGSICHGFILLKGKPHEAVKIAEVSDNVALLNALQAINNSSTAFFTVGCEKSFNREEEAFWAKGYIEFSFNYSELVTDAQTYFKLFFDFNGAIWESGFKLPVQFHWEIDRALFSARNIGGFTATVWVATAHIATEGRCKAIWAESITFLSDFLSSVQPYYGPTIY